MDVLLQLVKVILITIIVRSWSGRILSRREARRVLSLEQFEKTMEGIYTTSISKNTLDEAPFVYKPIQEILDNIDETVDVLEIIKPVYNFKAH